MEILDYFKKLNGIKTIGEITWAHRVNSREELDWVLKDLNKMFIESDINISSAGDIAISHDSNSKPGLTFEELLEGIKFSKKGIKLDFKTPNVLEDCLKKLNTVGLDQPVMLNADIFGLRLGNKFNAESFIRICQEMYPRGLLSLGFNRRFSPFSQNDVDQALNACKGIEYVTFPIRAKWLPKYWELIQQLIEQKGYTLTLWNEYHKRTYKEEVDETLLKWIKNHTDPAKTFYDLVDNNGRSLNI